SAPAFAQSQVVVSEQINSAEFVNIETIIFDQLNDDTTTIINTSQITDDIFLQLALINQSNSVESSIAINNGSGIDVDQLITGPQTNTEILKILNSSPADIFAFTQAGAVNQSNSLEASIAVSNSGEVADLTNSVSQTNTSAVAITNTDTASVSVAD